ncbi:MULTISPECIES: hypothetical protein [unclassified Novosphingobium]|uniref:hypothetical protein n=1 Tax=unclassified Novosphingobium TaxID=2644732 RepID=UPI000EDA8253|nr:MULTISPECIES: hypothetical protein [unclassified Novosphingobium]HCF25512.1 hypothetical protein [Novosphingobium sp.]HQV04788.1 hypothetical protein [Novosphingobium sp.]
MEPNEIFEVVRIIGPIIAIVTAIGCGAWLLDTRMRIKNGYPLNGSWGQKLYPKTSSEEGERIKLLSTENAQLRAELGSVKDRLGNIERIVTDSGYQLTQQIEALRIERKDVQ